MNQTCPATSAHDIMYTRRWTLLEGLEEALMQVKGEYSLVLID